MEKPFSFEYGPIQPVTAVEFDHGRPMTEADLQRTCEFYESFKELAKGPERLGLHPDDLRSSVQNPATICTEYKNSRGETVILPLFVPVEQLYWYNKDFLYNTYGDRPIYYFTHAQIPEDGEAKFFTEVSKLLDSGAVLITDKYTGEGGGGLKDWEDELSSHESLKLEALGGGEEKRLNLMYVAQVKLNDEGGVHEAPSFYEVFCHEVEAGNLAENARDGASVVDVIEGEEAERLWELYSVPFDKLTAEHPISGGFDREGFLEIMRSPDVVKVVNRVDGVISTLMTFVTGFEHATWLNEDWYKEHYGEYSETENIWIFPGIVTDENMRGQNYSAEVVKLAMAVTTKRGSDVLITFECSEISARYVPAIVKAGIESTGLGKVEGIDDYTKPADELEYEALYI